MNKQDSKHININRGQEQAENPLASNGSSSSYSEQLDERLLELEHEVMEEVEDSRTTKMLVKKIKRINDILELERGNE